MIAKKAIIHESELGFMTKCVLDYPNSETGGDFFGFWNKDGIPVIQFVTGPGKNTTRSATSFYQDIEYLHQCGNFLHDRFALEHIGSWHSHHQLSLDSPSGGDVTTMKNCLNNPNIRSFFISICNIKSEGTVNINGFIFSKEIPKLFEVVNWIKLPTYSAIRSFVESSTDIFTIPTTKKGRYKVTTTTFDEDSVKIVSTNKPDLLPDSYFDTEEGAAYLRKEYEKLLRDPGCSDVEVILNADKTVSITLKINGDEHEVRFPHAFPKDQPQIIKKGDEIEVFQNPAHSAKHTPLYYIFHSFFQPFFLDFTDGREKKEDQGDQTINITVK